METYYLMEQQRFWYELFKTIDKLFRNPDMGLEQNKPGICLVNFSNLGLLRLDEFPTWE